MASSPVYIHRVNEKPRSSVHDMVKNVTTEHTWPLAVCPGTDFSSWCIKVHFEHGSLQVSNLLEANVQLKLNLQPPGQPLCGAAQSTTGQP